MNTQEILKYLKEIHEHLCKDAEGYRATANVDVIEDEYDEGMIAACRIAANDMETHRDAIKYVIDKIERDAAEESLREPRPPSPGQQALF